MSDKPADYGREVRDTIVKSSVTGVFATALAITVFSPVGFGGLVGNSVASGLGLDTNASAADDPYASLPAFPSPFSTEEINAVRSQLARTTASLEITRAATEGRIEHIRSLALNGRGASFAPAPQVVEASALRLYTVEPATTSSASVEAVMTPASVSEVEVAPAIIGDFEEVALLPDRDLELAELLHAHRSR